MIRLPSPLNLASPKDFRMSQRPPFYQAASEEEYCTRPLLLLGSADDKLQALTRPGLKRLGHALSVTVFYMVDLK